MSNSNVAVGIFSVGLMVLGAGVASGQTASTVSAETYPNKPLRMILAGVGAGAEIAARLTAAGIAGPLGQNVIADSRGSATVAAEAVAKAIPDGYTLLLVGNNLWMTPLTQKTNYDPVRDFAPISMLMSTPNILIVHPALPVKSIRDLIDLAKAKPGVLNYAIGAHGGATHLAGELFKSMAGVNIVGVPYKSGGPAINAVVSGEAQLAFPGGIGMEPLIKAGKLRALGVCSPQQSALFPGLPTIASAGLPGYSSVSTNSLFAPAKTPAVIIRRLNQEVVRFVSAPDTKARFLELGVDVVGNPPEQLAATIKSDMVSIGKLYKDIGMGIE